MQNNRRNRGRRGGGNGNGIGRNNDNRIRGNAHQLMEKYKNLARDAASAGDRVLAEYYMQHADHYHRVLAEFRSRYEEQRVLRADDLDDDGGDDGDSEGIDSVTLAASPGFGAAAAAATFGEVGLQEREKASLHAADDDGDDNDPPSRDRDNRDSRDNGSTRNRRYAGSSRAGSDRAMGRDTGRDTHRDMGRDTNRRSMFDPQEGAGHTADSAPRAHQERPSSENGAAPRPPSVRHDRPVRAQRVARPRRRSAEDAVVPVNGDSSDDVLGLSRTLARAAPRTEDTRES